MIMKNRKTLSIIFTFIALLLVLSQVFVFRSSKSSIPKEILTLLESKSLQNAVLFHSFMFSMANEGIQLDGIQTITSEKDETGIQINRHESYFVIFVPLSEDVCSSCIDHAINSVREFFDDFSSNDRFILLAQGTNPLLNSRVYNKHIYTDFPDTFILNIKYNTEKKPFYFVLKDNMEASMFFVPNFLMPELTERYLNIISKKYFEMTDNNFITNTLIELELSEFVR